MRYTILLLFAVLLITAMTSSYIVSAEATDAMPLGNDVLGESLSEILKNPRLLIAVVIQFILGLALGYVSAKALKYILAFIGLLVLGAALSVWSLGGSVEDFITNLGVQAQQLLPIVKSFLATLGLMTIGPTSIGFIIGVLIALIKK